MDSVLVDRRSFQWLEKQWLLIPLVGFFGIALGALVAIDPKIGLGVSTLILLFIAILPRPERGLYFIAAFLPFEQITALSGNLSIVKFLSAITLISWIIKLVQTRSTFTDLIDKVNVALILFFAFATLSLAQSRDFNTALGRLITLGLLIILYFIITDLASEKKTLKKTMLILVVSGTLAAIFPLGQFLLGGATRAAGIYAEPSHSAVNLLAIIPIAVAFLSQSHGKRRLFFWASVFILIGGVLATLSRGTFVGLFVMILLLAGSKLTDKRLRIILITFLVIALLSFPFVQQSSARFSLDGIKSDRGAGRLDLWYVGESIFADHWLLGIGLAGFPNTYVKYATHVPWILQRRIVPVVAHNLFIETAIETGLLGFAFFLGFIVLALRSQRQALRAYLANRKIAEATLASMVGISFFSFLVASLFLSTIYLKILWVLLGLMTATRQLRLDDAK